MMTDKKTLQLTKLDVAKREVGRAEKDIDRLLGEVRVAPRAEKTTVSQVLEDAFAALRAAKTELAELERLIKSDDA
jgi:hypothetical protein